MTTMFELWQLPAVGGQELEEESFTWSTAGAGAQPLGPAGWRGRAGNGGIIGEIKAHTASGIAAGWRQLHQRLIDDRRSRTPSARGPLSPAELSRGVLVTYQKVSPDVVQVHAAFANDRSRWILVGQGRYEWARLVPLESCPSCLGSKIEGSVRDIVRQRTGLTLRPKADAQQQGADLIMSLELSEFLAELTAELQAELAELTNEINELAFR